MPAPAFDVAPPSFSVDPFAAAPAASLLDPLAAIAGWRADGVAAVLATVTETWGSSPRPPGSMMAVAADGRIVGSVSGGCVEASVIESAMEALADGTPKLLSFGVTDDEAWSVGLACGGTIRVLVSPVRDAAA
jgi:xanthine dehydrogenase accessory factor